MALLQNLIKNPVRKSSIALLGLSFLMAQRRLPTRASSAVMGDENQH
jgi:hypothetical protein